MVPPLQDASLQELALPSHRRFLQPLSAGGRDSHNTTVPVVPADTLRLASLVWLAASGPAAILKHPRSSLDGLNLD